MRVEPCPVPLLPPLYAAYVDRRPEALGRFEADPWDAGTWRRRLDALAATRPLRLDAAAVAEALRAFNREIGADERAMASIDAIAAGAPVVVGGHQAMLFGGPLFVFLKALSVIRLAEDLSARLGERIVPVFWIAGEDHDFAEVGGLYALRPDWSIEKIALEPPDPERRLSVSRLHLSEAALREAADRLAATWPETEFKPAAEALLRDAVAGGGSLVQVFGRLMARLFAGTGLVFLDSDDPRLRVVERPAFRRLIEAAPAVRGALAAGAAVVRDLGFSPQLDAADGAYLFLHTEATGRVGLRLAGDGFSDRRGEHRFSTAELLALAEAAPERLSTAAGTRPIMQEMLFPVLAAVLGPSEVAYWAELKEAFRALRLVLPPAVPRFQATVVEPSLARALEDVGGEAHRAVANPAYIEACQAAWLEAQGTARRLEERFQEIRRAIEALYAPLVAELAALEKGLGPMAEENLRKILGHVDFLAARALQAEKRRLDGAARRFERIRQLLAPLDRTQERVIGPFHFIVRHGLEAWRERWRALSLPLDGRHHLVYWDGGGG
ncbi:MAG: bacillithiol biosynthesis cysteine-adding enzyme BshC [Hydrogenibacillus schlegelii]|uniref:Putative cysteine ligase BshC n=1 Tax=Hydrogenibacillus schlegelii TaxID=1484 RepID=A0A947CWB4_HYDSH|nr:bacillithiol biosynthesis cysteine-adding enzyme BshC [Hydrogenibacillus schlegelii]